MSVCLVFFSKEDHIFPLKDRKKVSCWVKALAPQAEGWEFGAKPRQT